MLVFAYCWETQKIQNKTQFESCSIESSKVMSKKTLIENENKIGEKGIIIMNSNKNNYKHGNDITNKFNSSTQLIS